ncbi:hypothetical protein PENSPDRAFT_695192 [Peniophora sp. CONT]|nr:hypothetical protein PENSPDRAFT_695192 [Peniophora sp. CONT]
MTSSRRKTVSPWIRDDLESYLSVDADRFLKVFLRKVVKNPPVDLDHDLLLNDCLNAVTQAVCSDANVKGHLQSYCKEENELARYKPFVMAFNRALQLLSGVHSAGALTLQDASGMLPLFSRNDPIYIANRYPEPDKAELETGLKPDVVMVSLAAGRVRHNKNASTSWDDLAFGKAGEKPPKKSELPAGAKKFTWQHVLMSVEFKHNRVVKTPLPTTWKTDLVSAIPAISDMRATAPPSQEKPGKGVQKATKRSAPGDSSAQPSSGGSGSTGNKKRATLSTVKAQSQPSSSGAKGSGTALETEGDVPPLVQCGNYGTNMLCRSPAVAHSINIMIFDEVAFIWWYDRQGAIQSTGINFITDLPRFLVLLLAFQRFELPDWGFITELDPEARRIHCDDAQTGKNSCIVTFEGGQTARMHMHSPLYSPFSLKGRGTRIVPVDSLSGVAGAAGEYVAKINWVDKARDPEHVLVNGLRERLNDNSHVTDHLPMIVASKTYPLDTGTIRAALGIEVEASRVLRIIVSEKLRPITELQGAEFLQAFLDIVLCHYIVWVRGGVFHRDPSLTNAMYRKATRTNDAGDSVTINHGVLNDFDLATTAKTAPDRVDRLERTGTLPFMALELLQAKFNKTPMPHLYRHDLEAFYWMLVWTCNCMVGGKEFIDDSRAELLAWKTGDYRTCDGRKRQWETGGPDYWARLVQPTQGPLWAITKTWLLDFTERLRYFASKAFNAGKPVYEAKPEASWLAFCEMLESEGVKERLAELEEEGQGMYDIVQAFLTRARLYLEADQ